MQRNIDQKYNQAYSTIRHSETIVNLSYYFQVVNFDYFNRIFSVPCTAYRSFRPQYIHTDQLFMYIIYSPAPSSYTVIGNEHALGSVILLIHLFHLTCHFKNVIEEHCICICHYDNSSCSAIAIFSTRCVYFIPIHYVVFVVTHPPMFSRSEKIGG